MAVSTVEKNEMNNTVRSRTVRDLQRNQESCIRSDVTFSVTLQAIRGRCVTIECLIFVFQYFNSTRHALAF